MANAKEPVRPVHTVRYGGIKAAIWRNQTRNGTMYNVTVVRSYKDGKQWKDTSSFGYDDLLVLAKALDDCHTWIHQEYVNRRETEGKPEEAEEEVPV